MRRLLLLLALLPLLASCDFAFHWDVIELDENPFDPPQEIASGKGPSDRLSFAVISDVHLNKELSEEGVYRNDSVFLSFLETEDPDAVFILGDLVEDGIERDYREAGLFLDKVRSAAGCPVIYTLGNHDIGGSDLATWSAEFGLSATEAFTIADTVIYKLNSAYRLFGQSQLSYLSQAIGDDGAAYHIILSHIPLGSKGLNQSLFEFTIADIDERNALLDILSGSGRNLILSGHVHSIEVMNDWDDDLKEFIFSAYHRKDLPFFGARGTFYLLELDQATGRVEIKGYGIDNADSAVMEASFTLE